MDKLIISEKDLSLIEDKALNVQQIQHLLKHTPKKYVRTRPAKGGGTWEYVTGGYVKKVLNLMFGWDWDFEILSEMVQHGEVIVKGRLTCRANGKVIVKTQYGNKEIATRRGTDFPLSIGNDMKAAATDCLKKCAAEIGIAADIYNREEFREITVQADLPKLSDEAYRGLLKKVKNGEQGLIEQALQHFELTEDQKTELINIEMS